MLVRLMSKHESPIVTVSSLDGWHCPTDSIPGVTSAAALAALSQLYNIPEPRACTLSAYQDATPSPSPLDGTVRRDDASLADLYVRSRLTGIFEDNVGADNQHG